MKAILLSIALLGDGIGKKYIDDFMSGENQPKRSYPQEQLVQENLNARQQSQLEADERQTWIIGGAVVVGLVLLGLILRKKPT